MTWTDWAVTDLEPNAKFFRFAHGTRQFLSSFARLGIGDPRSLNKCRIRSAIIYLRRNDRDDMAASAAEFRDLLSREAHPHIDMEKLRESARHGCPDEVRADVWRLLMLGESAWLDMQDAEEGDAENGDTKVDDGDDVENQGTATRAVGIFPMI